MSNESLGENRMNGLDILQYDTISSQETKREVTTLGAITPINKDRLILTGWLYINMHWKLK